MNQTLHDIIISGMTPPETPRCVSLCYRFFSIRTNWDSRWETSKMTIKLDVLTHTFEPSTMEAETGRLLWAQRQPGLHDKLQASPGYIVRSINMNHPRHNYLVWIVHFLFYNNQKRKYLLSPGFQKISQSHWPRHITWPGIGNVLIGLKPSNLKFKLSSSNYFYASFSIFKK